MRRRTPKAVARTRPALPILPLTALALLSALVLAGCNTFEGMGEDMQQAGEAIEDEADEDTGM